MKGINKMKRIYLLSVMALYCALICNAQGVDKNQDNLGREMRIAQSCIEKVINPDYDFNIIEIEEMKKYDYEEMLKEYLIPNIFEDKIDDNRKTFDEIKSYSELTPFSRYIPVIIGLRLKGSEENEEWIPSWNFILLTNDDEPVGLVPYYP